MSSFQTGMQLGISAFDSAEQSRRQKKIDERADRDDARKQADQARVDQGYADVENTGQGIGDQGAQLKETYGMTPTQVQTGIKAGGIDGLKNKLATYDTPDSYDLQGAAPGTAAPMSGAEGFDGSPLPAKEAPGGIKPRYTADQLKDKPATDLDRERAMGRLALAKRDDQGIRSSQAAQKTLEYDQDFKAQLVGFTGSPEQMKTVSESIHTASPNIKVSPLDDQGFVTMSVTKPDKTQDVFRLNKQQQATLYAGANMFYKDPERSLKIMGGINSSLNEVLTNEGNSIFKVNQENNKVAGEKTKAELLSQRISAVGASRGPGVTPSKPEPDKIEKLIDNVIDKDTNLNSDQKLTARSYVVMASKLEGMTPENAARVGSMAIGQVVDAKGSKVTTQLNPTTGTWDRYFSDPEIMGGTPVPLARSTGKTKELMETKNPKDLKRQVESMLTDMYPNAPEDMNNYIKAAHDPAASKKMIDVLIANKAPQALIGALKNKLNLIRELGIRPALPPTANKEPEVRDSDYSTGNPMGDPTGMDPVANNRPEVRRNVHYGLADGRPGSHIPPGGSVSGIPY